MGDKSKIEWTDASWTPIRARNKSTGKIGWYCEHATPGCEHCYAESMNARLGTGLPFKPGHRKDVELFLDEDMLLQPLRWKKPRMTFVCSMTDLFADFVPDECIDKVFAVMALCPQHTFQVLTKRADRMRNWTAALGSAHAKLHRFWNGQAVPGLQQEALDVFPQYVSSLAHPSQHGLWPLPNVWFGASAEDQRRYDERREALENTPAAVRFWSLEPLLGPIDLGLGQFGAEANPNWIIVGGESGRDARPMHPDWARSIRDQCAAAGVPFFFKQHGEFVSVSMVEGEGPHFHFPDGATVRRIGKRAAGRLLDGREHNEMPERAR